MSSSEKTFRGNVVIKVMASCPWSARFSVTNRRTAASVSFAFSHPSPLCLLPPREGRGKGNLEGVAEDGAVEEADLELGLVVVAGGRGRGGDGGRGGGGRLPGPLPPGGRLPVELVLLDLLEDAVLGLLVRLLLPLAILGSLAHLLVRKVLLDLGYALALLPPQLLLRDQLRLLALLPLRFASRDPRLDPAKSTHQSNPSTSIDGDGAKPGRLRLLLLIAERCLLLRGLLEVGVPRLGGVEFGLRHVPEQLQSSPICLLSCGRRKARRPFRRRCT